MRGNPFEGANRMLDAAVAGFMPELGSRVQERRSSVGFSREDFSRMLEGVGVSMTADELARWESGESGVRDPDVRLLGAVILLLEISLDQLFVASFQRPASPGVP